MDLRASGGESPVNVGGEGAVPGVIYKENSLSSINTPPSLPRADSAVSMTKERSVSMSDVKVCCGWGLAVVIKIRCLDQELHGDMNMNSLRWVCYP